MSAEVSIAIVKPNLTFFFNTCLPSFCISVVKRSIEGFGGLTGYDLGDGMTSYGGYMGNGNMVYDINNMHEAIAAERK